jgi:hypothetical protein
MKTMTNRMTFQEFRDFMWESDKGKVVDSLIATEVGLLDYETWWQAHLDVSEHLGETSSQDDFIFEFLIGVAELISMADASEDIDKVLGARAHD